MADFVFLTYLIKKASKNGNAVQLNTKTELAFFSPNICVQKGRKILF